MSSRVTDDARSARRRRERIDLVLPYRPCGAAISRSRDMVEAVRDLVDQGRLLKVILETGELQDAGAHRSASRIAIEAGADFIKTSTGKTPVSATPEAAEIMLDAIKASGRQVGLKPSGGIRTVADAKPISISPTASWGGLGDAADVPHRREQRLRRPDRRHRRRRAPARRHRSY